MNYLVPLNFANICFLGPHSAAEGPHLVPISLKIGSPMGPLFDNLGSQWHVATVKTGSLTGSACKNQVLLRSWTNNVSDNFNINVRMLQNNV